MSNRAQAEPETARRESSGRGHARSWVQAKLIAASVRAAMADEEPRQLTIRLNPVISALFEALTARLGVTRNNAANVLLGAALIEAVSGLDADARTGLLKDVEKTLGCRLDQSPPPEPPGVFRVVLDDIGAIVEKIESLFRSGARSG